MLAIAKQTRFRLVSELEGKAGERSGAALPFERRNAGYCRNAAKIIEPELPNQFKIFPSCCMEFAPSRRPRQATASNAQAPAPDGSSPGWFNLRAYQPEKQVSTTRNRWFCMKPCRAVFRIRWRAPGWTA